MHNKYLEEFKESGHTDFNEYMIAKFEYLEWAHEEQELWVTHLEKMLMDIYSSGLLKETEFEAILKELHHTLDV